MASLYQRRSVRALASVGSFLGLQQSSDEVDKWTKNVNHQAKLGNIGFVISTKPCQIAAQDDYEETAFMTELNSSLSHIMDGMEFENLREQAFSNPTMSIAPSPSTDNMNIVNSEILPETVMLKTIHETDVLNPCYEESHICLGKLSSILRNAPSCVTKDPLRYTSQTFTGTNKHLTVQFSDEHLESFIPWSEEGSDESNAESNIIKDKSSLDDNNGNLDDEMVQEILRPQFVDSSVPSVYELNSQDNDREVVNHELPSDVNEDDFLYRAEALQNYKQFIKNEKMCKIKELEQQKEILKSKLDKKRDDIENLLEVAKAHYSGEHGIQDSNLRKLLRIARGNKKAKTQGTSEMFVRRQLESLHLYTPWFTYLICMVQVLAFCITCGIGGITEIGLEPKLMLTGGVVTFLGIETKEHWIIPNIWIGPSRTKMIGFGALFAPCMRRDYHIQELYRVAYNFSNNELLGCCKSATGLAVATLYSQECSQFSSGAGIFEANKACSQRSDPRPQQNIWPCCYGYKGQCQMTTYEHCQFLEGFYHTGEYEHCSQVNCLSSLCAFGGLERDETWPYRPAHPHQAYRLLSAVLYHHGIFHLVLVVLVQFFIARSIEAIAGWLRMFCLYMIPAYMGLLAGAVMDPYSPHVGGGSGVSALIAVILVELVQSWKLVPKPWIEVVKLFVIMVLFYFAGTLPCVDNYALLAGFVFGLLCGIIFLPYISFGSNHRFARRVIIVFAIPMLILFVFILFYLFYQVQTLSELCSWCSYFNCIPYTETMCKVQELW